MRLRMGIGGGRAVMDKWNSGAGVPLNVTDTPWNVVAGNPVVWLVVPNPFPKRLTIEPGGGCTRRAKRGVADDGANPKYRESNRILGIVGAWSFHLWRGLSARAKSEDP